MEKNTENTPIIVSVRKSLEGSIEDDVVGEVQKHNSSVCENFANLAGISYGKPQDCDQTGDVMTACAIDGIFDDVKEEDLVMVGGDATCGLVNSGKNSLLAMSNHKDIVLVSNLDRKIFEVSFSFGSVYYCVKDKASLVYFNSATEEDTGQHAIFTIGSFGCFVDESAFCEEVGADPLYVKAFSLKDFVQVELLEPFSISLFNDEKISVFAGGLNVEAKKWNPSWLVDVAEGDAKLFYSEEGSAYKVEYQNKTIFLFV